MIQDRGQESFSHPDREEGGGILYRGGCVVSMYKAYTDTKKTEKVIQNKRVYYLLVQNVSHEVVDS
jgi:hypothetical protein